MRSLANVLKGGDSGESAIVAGKPADSPLYLATLRKGDDWKAMPPKENDKLYAEQMDWIKAWIEGGAPWPDEARQKEIAAANHQQWEAEDGVIVKTVGALSESWANRRYKPDALWAYQPVKKPAVKSENAIDELLALHFPKDAAPAPAADARTFIRRATFDLLGLPPTPEEVHNFERDSMRDPQSAIRNLIDRLLDSPHYGEQWARHWLDVVRYADSSGFANDYERGNTWRYRDYVVRSFNDDKPYDRFIKEQIAGDELDPKDPEKLIATGMLRMGPWELTGMEVPKIARQRFLDDVTNAVGETFLSHSLQCARCHDHKFDPVPTHDYYSMQACFGTTQLVEQAAPFLKNENLSGFDERKNLDVLVADYNAQLERLDKISLDASDKWFEEKKLDRTLWDNAIAEAREKMAKTKKRSFAEVRGVFFTARKSLEKQNIPETQYPPWGIGFSPDDFGLQRIAEKGLQRISWEVERYQPFAFAVYSGRTPKRVGVTEPIRMPQDRMTQGELEQTAILTGGDPFGPSTKVQPGTLSVLSGIKELNTEVPDGIEGRRAALAKWIANPANPLTTRSIVNRLWLWHFGQAIAGNPNNFGSTGKKPTHPELLDWLAASFVEKGWSIKAMHRLIMTSEAYRRASVLPDGATKLSREEQEQSYLVFKARRLTSEELRDTMLATTGELNRTLGGIPNRPEISLEVAMQPRQVMGTFASAWVPNPLPEQRHRRSLYALRLRGLRDPFMEVFNDPSPDFSCEKRDVSTVTPQVFSLFNSQNTYSRALALAHRVVKEKPADDAAAIQRMYQLAYQRDPTPSQLDKCLAHWQKLQPRQATLALSASKPLLEITREAVEENTGEKFSFAEKLPGYAGFVPDLQPNDVDARTRALADVCLALLNTAEFSYLY